ncbi:gastrula zinc finger protein XlCGF26.1-like isoform X1 [Cylas formicarius]|uniref:gastrula zinc finger protein XlCGF26.1-like isoform X1 n=2 Tax=Cylas formicarius TaxID=197179 RepID=UPI0029586C4E|nr:gastrula zinc finger protein XlCGF26.1-like isoform X1 [Cylas formicarius]
MNMNLSTFSYWALEPHFMENPTITAIEDKSKFFSAMCLMNSRQDPPIFNTKLDNPVYNCPVTNCDCVGDCTMNLVKPDVKPTTKEVNMAPDIPPIPEKERPFKCDRCTKTFLLKHHLTTHEKTHTGARPHVCSHCGKSFTHKYCLNTHLLLHSNERPYECLQCKKRFTLKHHLISHERVHIREKPFLCGECGKSFPLKKQLITHEKFHRGERPYICKECGDTFAQENHLVMHLRFHGSLNSFACSQCGATFTRKFELVNHERIHGKEPMSCPTCSKEFLQKRTLIAHIKLHDTQLALTCLHCGDHFQDEKRLLQHQSAVHSYEEKPMNSRIGYEQKPANDQSCNSKSNLKNLSKPAKNKKFFCDICFRKFSSKHGLTQHKKRQHGSGSCQNFVCTFCNKSFTEKNDLVLHSRQHGSIYPSQVVNTFG